MGNKKILFVIFCITNFYNTSCILKFKFLSKFIILKSYKNKISKIKYLDKWGHTKKAKEIINTVDEGGVSPLHEACETGNVAAVHFILEHGNLEIVNQPNNLGDMPIDFASKNNQIIDHIIHAFLYWAARKGNEQTFSNTFIRLPEDKQKEISYLFEFADEEGKTMLHWACAHGKSVIVNFLLAYGNKKRIVNKVDKNGNTPLYMCCFYDNYDNRAIAKKLLKNGATKSIDRKNKQGETPLSHVLDNETVPLIKLLTNNYTQIEDHYMHKEEYKRLICNLKREERKKTNKKDETSIWFDQDDYVKSYHRKGPPSL